MFGKQISDKFRRIDYAVKSEGVIAFTATRNRKLVMPDETLEFNPTECAICGEKLSPAFPIHKLLSAFPVHSGEPYTEGFVCAPCFHREVHPAREKSTCKTQPTKEV